MDPTDPPFTEAQLYDAVTAPVSNFPVVSLSLKRRASSPLEDTAVEGGRKRLKGDTNNQSQEALSKNSHFLEELEEELRCGCCSALVYRPVIVMPCQHFFCGSCCVLWIRNNGTNCPSCRSVSTIVTPFRAIQGTIDTFLRAAPHKARTERECLQADEIYIGSNLRLPVPREPSPEPNIPDTDYFQPCPHCSPGNHYGWVCPQPIPDPHLDPDHAWPLNDGSPPGHGHCGNCETILALRAPSTTMCDMCQAPFCGINVQERCVAAPLLAQQPHGLGKLDDLVESTRFFECFAENTVEVNFLIDYMTAQDLTPKHIYREIIAHVRSHPQGFQLLIDANILALRHNVSEATESNATSSPARICRVCSAEVFFWGLKEWWIRERQKGFLEPDITSRLDCPQGSECAHQKDPGHAREFNHIIVPPPLPVIPEVETLPLVVDVQEDLLTSSPATPDFHDAVDAIQ